MGFYSVHQKINNQTIFINSSGLFQLVAHSNRKSAKKLWENITEIILPELPRAKPYTHHTKIQSSNELETLKHKYNILETKYQAGLERIEFLTKNLNYFLDTPIKIKQSK